MSIARAIALGVAACVLGPAHAAVTVDTSGTTIVVRADGEATRANDEAHLVFSIEERDRDRAAAASRVNENMRRAIAIVKREDPQARLLTRDLYTYPVNAPGPPKTPGQALAIVGWRVVESLEVTTRNLAALPKTVAMAESVLNLNGLRFQLSREDARAADDQAIADAYANLLGRIGAIARAMGREPAEAALESLDFDPPPAYGSPVPRALAAMRSNAQTIAEPDFEPGEATVSTHVVGHFRLR